MDVVAKTHPVTPTDTAPRLPIARTVQRRFVLLLAIAVAGIGVVFGTWLISGRAKPMTWSIVQASIDARFDQVAQIETAELAAWLADSDRPRPLLIDVRTAAEFSVSHLPGAVHAERVEHILPLIGPASAQRPVVLYCSVGWRSAIVADALRQVGSERVWNLRGSIFQWANEGRALAGADEVSVDTVHPFDERWGALLERERWAPDSLP